MYVLGALNTKTNIYTIPSKAEKGNEYKCIDCNQKVIFRKGDIRVAHFAHYSPTNTCSYYEHPNESQLHKDAKYKLADWLKNKMKITMDLDCPECSSTSDEIDIKYLDNDEIIIEYRDPDGKYIADIALINNNKVRYIFEIKHTHATLTHTRPEPWFEISTEHLFTTEKEQIYDNKQDCSNYNELSVIIGCERKSKNRYCNNCKAKTELWVENLPILNKKGGVEVHWKQENPCICCKRTSYNPYFSKEFRQICKICLDNEYEELKKKYDYTSNCMFADDD